MGHSLLSRWLVSVLNSTASLGESEVCLLHSGNVFSFGRALGCYSEIGSSCLKCFLHFRQVVLDRFTPHHLFGTDDLWTWFEWPFSKFLLLLPLCCFLCHSLSNFNFCHSITFLCLVSLRSINPLHSFMKSGPKIADNLSSYMYLSWSSLQGCCLCFLSFHLTNFFQFYV